MNQNAIDWDIQQEIDRLNRLRTMTWQESVLYYLFGTHRTRKTRLRDSLSS